MATYPSRLWSRLRTVRAQPVPQNRAQPVPQNSWDQRGYEYAATLSSVPFGVPADASASHNPLESYFYGHATGRGIWKWRHYFEIYHRHLAKFVGRDVHVMEVGVYSGGSLAMWSDYFGADSVIYGVDIEPACRAYETDRIQIFIGDQADRSFWDRVLQRVTALDVVIDDGGHQPEQQAITLEALLPSIRPGGVYLCEDVHGTTNRFHDYVAGLSRHLNAMESGDEPGHVQPHVQPIGLQRLVHSVHLYPYVVVIERHLRPPVEFFAPKHGTEWQPYYDR